MKTEIDTLSFFLGMARADGIMNYLTMQAGVDTAYMDAFYKGFREGAKHYSPKDVAYAEGMRIAHLINNNWVKNFNQEIFLGDSIQTINRNSLLAGFYQGVKHSDDTKIMQAQSYSQMKLETVKNDYKRTKYADIIAAGEKLLADNKNKADIKTTASGLQYKIIQEGTGAIPDEKARVKVNYRGTLVDGTEFDSSYKNNAPSSFRVGGVIRGWSEALQMMPVGSKWELYIPQDLAYGSNGQLPSIPPFATLIFEVELLEIEPN
jgi:FKBP-type peptidyl-prolyl cis-trans isomerase FklB